MPIPAYRDFEIRVVEVQTAWCYDSVHLQKAANPFAGARRLTIGLVRRGVVVGQSRHGGTNFGQGHAAGHSQQSLRG